MNAGELRHRITIQRDVSDGTTDVYGNPAPDWKSVCSVWAGKKGVKGTAFYQAAAEYSTSDIVYIIRYRPDIKTGMRIIDGDRIGEIKVPPVDPDFKKQWLQIHTSEVLKSGN